MSGSRAGGKKTAIKITKKDPDFYKKIGSIGGKNGHTGGWAHMSTERHRALSAKGGRISRRTKKA